jgi:GrpB-like predicted nucleotidyltransferase (UPF0157 family)
MSPGPIQIVEYLRNWVFEFRTAAASLRDRLGPTALRIDHIGSTSVPGLAAKDVIDIQRHHPEDRDAYVLTKDPVCDLIMVAAADWAARTSWVPGPSDA